MWELLPPTQTHKITLEMMACHPDGHAKSLHSSDTIDLAVAVITAKDLITGAGLVAVHQFNPGVHAVDPDLFATDVVAPAGAHLGSTLQVDLIAEDACTIIVGEVQVTDCDDTINSFHVYILHSQ